ncbi:MAG TPA: FAD-binding protein [Kofleriaceae bacterium]|nr:FAD-binding protein [Kofleriaceae bacterium]
MVRPVATRSLLALALVLATAAPAPAGRLVRRTAVTRPAERTRVRPRPSRGRVRPVRLVNHGRNIRWTPRAAYRPGKDIDELASLIRQLDRDLPAGATIKAGGSRHSWSPAAASDGVYIHPEKMKFIEAPARSELRRDLGGDLVRIGSGTTIREINRTLWKQGKALPVLGGFDGQTLGGVLPTGTHGSVLAHGPLVDMVQSIDLVTGDGRKIRLEPEGGITDPARFRRRDWTLIQDDDAFHAALINMGTFGVVHSYVLEATDRFYLNEVRTATTGADAERVLAGGNIYRIMETGRPADRRQPAALRGFAGHPERAYHLELLWNVASDKMVVTSRQPLNRTRTRALEKDEPAHFEKSRNRNLLRPFIMKSAHSRPHLTELAAEYLGKPAAALTNLAARVAPRLVPRLVDMSLRGLRDTGYTQRSYNVFNIGDGANRIPAQSATLSVPLRGDAYLRAMGVLRTVQREFAAEHKKFQTGPISIRFVKGTRALLGDPEDVAKFEIIFAGNGKRAQRLSRELVWRQYQALHRELGADVRFHWGQLMPEQFNAVAKQRIRESFPAHQRFEAQRRRFDPHGRFMNRWQRDILPR